VRNRRAYIQISSSILQSSALHSTSSSGGGNEAQAVMPVIQTINTMRSIQDTQGATYVTPIKLGSMVAKLPGSGKYASVMTFCLLDSTTLK